MLKNNCCSSRNCFTDVIIIYHSFLKMNKTMRYTEKSSDEWTSTASCISSVLRVSALDMIPMGSHAPITLRHVSIDRQFSIIRSYGMSAFLLTSLFVFKIFILGGFRTYTSAKNTHKTEQKQYQLSTRTSVIKLNNKYSSKLFFLNVIFIIFKLYWPSHLE